MKNQRMKSILLPAELVDGLAELAKSEQRSVRGQARLLIEDALALRSGRPISPELARELEKLVRNSRDPRTGSMENESVQASE